MIRRPASILSTWQQRSRAAALTVIAGLLAGGCSSGSGLAPLDGLLSSGPPTSPATTAQAEPQAAKSELDRAIEYWAEQYRQKPHDLKAALAYAQNLKAAGQKEQAFAVVQGAAVLHGDSRELASEYGRLALEFDQVALADKLLASADNPAKPDWRVISARGTVLAKQGQFGDAIPFFERALTVSPNQTSVMNNLAMAHAANGDPKKAEEILRTALQRGGDAKLKQNLALVMGLQGRHDEAKTMATSALPADAATSDADYIKRMVKMTPQQVPQAQPAIQKAPEKPRPSGPRVIEAKAGNQGSGTAGGLRETAAPGDVQSAAGSWSTSVSKAR